MKILIKGITQAQMNKAISNASDCLTYEMAGNMKFIYQSMSQTSILEMPNTNKYEIYRNDVGHIVIMINNPYVLNNMMLVFEEKDVKGIEIRME